MKNINHWAAQQLVQCFCPQTSSWPREMKIAKKLLKLSPNLNAWMALSNRNVGSLAYFLKSENSVYIPTSQENPYHLDLELL